MIFHLYCMTSLVINKSLETSNKDTDTPREVKKKEQNEITQMTSKD